MNRTGLIFLLLLSAGAGHLRAQQPVNKLKLWYKEPAIEWSQALPLGNGRLGAMVFGGTSEELIQLNEATLWSGGPVNNNINPDAAKYLPAVRAALFQEKYHQADSLLRKMQGAYSQSFLPLGDVRIRQELKDAAVSQYYRDLDIADAKAVTRFTSSGVTYTREMFISAPDQVIVIRLKANKKGQLNFTASTSSQLRYSNVVTGKKEIAMRGKAPSQADPNYVNYNKEPIKYDAPGSCNGMRYELRMRAISPDGSITTDTSGITVKHATEVTLLLTAATSFNGYNKCPDSEGVDEKTLVDGYLKKAAALSYDNLLKRHEQDYHTFFNRVSLQLDGADQSTLPTDERLRRYTAGGKDATLESLYFQFGRYLLISSSRTKAAPANLQGIWNKELRAPWSSNYTININTEMNYWPAEVCNLMEMQRPLYQLLKELSVTGQHTAGNFYNTRGWVAHHNTDIWAISNPVGDIGKGDPQWANWMMGGNWLCQFLWQHYRYTGDVQFLRDTAYPIMKSAALFSLDWLVKDPASGYLVTAPATSPENMFVLENGTHEAVAVASTMDMTIIRELFNNVIKAGEVLQVDNALRDSLQVTADRLYPFKIGKDGSLQEWYKDWPSAEVEHRHISHLYGLFPGDQISPSATPELANAAKRTLEIRGDGGTGWSKAWKINTWARLEDGNHAYKLLRELLTLTGKGSIDMHDAGGTYANLFCAHPPFQIDGNFGGTSGIAQMLLNGQSNAIHLLPALPDSWSSGRVKGLLAFDGHTIDMSWKEGKITSVTVHATRAGTCYLVSKHRLKATSNAQLAPMKPKDPAAGYPYALKTSAGGVYTLQGAE
ncbi:glycoside hydrolase family 95 protein [Chitinophaga ginsengisoli]|uniref:Alpha-L-fucosidase 2 n=1 Tax=Chitinophaga ginsengisoli TaxID=363837 RepID=A0A2P8FTG9_9BACT|nr:glycoside hydrolase family 95 protein [Chitinophaga ginsengisoli]PSL25001.1 alpha-L-fucosidase 2 [Chitinophaga ginsengisoli]